MAIDDKVKSLEDKILLEENTCTQILGVFIFMVAALNILEAILKGGIRFIVNLDSKASLYYEIGLAFIKLIAITIFFIVAIMKMRRLYFHSPEIKKLLIIWAIILIPVQVIYELSSLMYTNMMNYLIFFLGGYDSAEAVMKYSWIYNSTHGFKYMGMFLAILLGIVFTGLILEEKKMLIVSAVLAVIFMISFLFLGMFSLKLDIVNIDIGVNWTGVIFHGLQTVGLLVLGIDIHKNYVRTEIVLGKK